MTWWQVVLVIVLSFAAGCRAGYEKGKDDADQWWMDAALKLGYETMRRDMERNNNVRE